MARPGHRRTHPCQPGRNPVLPDPLMTGAIADPRAVTESQPFPWPLEDLRSIARP